MRGRSKQVAQATEANQSLDYYKDRNQLDYEKIKTLKLEGAGGFDLADAIKRYFDYAVNLTQEQIHDLVNWGNQAAERANEYMRQKKQTKGLVTLAAGALLGPWGGAAFGVLTGDDKTERLEGVSSGLGGASLASSSNNFFNNEGNSVATNATPANTTASSPPINWEKLGTSLIDTYSKVKLADIASNVSRSSAQPGMNIPPGQQSYSPQNDNKMSNSNVSPTPVMVSSDSSIPMWVWGLVAGAIALLAFGMVARK